MNDRGTAPEPGGKIRNSITNKLHSKLFFRLIGIFFSLNIMICIICALALALYSENKVAGALELLEEHQLPASGEWMEFAGTSVRFVPGDPPGIWAPWPFAERLPYETESAYRGFRAGGGGFGDSLRSITYVVAVGVDGVTYEVGQRIGDFILYFAYAFAALMFIELLTLLSKTADDRKMIRKTLGPISDLARAAQSFSDVGKHLDHEKALALAGRLDRIDAGRLDMRIPADDLQEELRSVAVAINGMLDRINQSYAAQARFVSDASHELRTPIAVIQGYANLLDRWGKEDEKTLTESIAAIKDEAENMKELVEQLLFLARGDSNRISLVEERIGLDALINEVVGEMRMLDGAHEFKVSGESVAVLADRALIKQALRILVDNAVKYTDQGGEITVSVAKTDGSARVSVADNGIGISPDILPYVFDRFVRADESRARATGGAGLGLSIAQWIASRHKGHMEVLSREGIGTRITIVLPAVIEEQPPETAAAVVAAATALPPVLTLADAPADANDGATAGSLADSPTDANDGAPADDNDNAPADDSDNARADLYADSPADSTTDSLADSPSHPFAERYILPVAGIPTLPTIDALSLNPADSPSFRPIDSPSFNPADSPSFNPIDSPSSQPADQPKLPPEKQPPEPPPVTTIYI